MGTCASWQAFPAKPVAPAHRVAPYIPSWDWPRLQSFAAGRTSAAYRRGGMDPPPTKTAFPNSSGGRPRGEQILGSHKGIPRIVGTPSQHHTTAHRRGEPCPHGATLT